MVGGASSTSVGGRVTLESGYSGATSSGSLIIQVSSYTFPFEVYIISHISINTLPFCCAICAGNNRPQTAAKTDGAANYS